MVVITASTGCRRRKLRSNSSASATRYQLLPRRAPVPETRRRPPTITVGSSPASVRMVPTSDVVVVLPWVPATAMPYLRRISSASISARRMTVMPRARAAPISGLSSWIADERTTRSAPTTCSGEWPIAHGDAERLEMARRLARRLVRAGDLEVVVEQHLGDAAHAGAADADEVDAAQAGHLPEHRRRAHRATSARRSTMASAAPGRARRRAASAMRCSVASGVSSAPPTAPRAAPRAAPMSPPRRRARAPRRRAPSPGVALLVAGRDRQRHQDRRPPGGAQLGERDGAGARDDEVSGGERRRDVVDEGHAPRRGRVARRRHPPPAKPPASTRRAPCRTDGGRAACVRPAAAACPPPPAPAR